MVMEVSSNTEIRDRVEKVIETSVDAETVSNFTGFQEWYRSRVDVLQSIENDGHVVVASGSCDMVELLDICIERGWSMREEAAEVFVVEKKNSSEGT